MDCTGFIYLAVWGFALWLVLTAYWRSWPGRDLLRRAHRRITWLEGLECFNYPDECKRSIVWWSTRSMSLTRRRMAIGLR
jgi:hypothetical protein